MLTILLVEETSLIASLLIDKVVESAVSIGTVLERKLKPSMSKMLSNDVMMNEYDVVPFSDKLFAVIEVIVTLDPVTVMHDLDKEIS